MARKTDAERLEDYEKKIEQLKNKKQRLANQLKEKERKERTRRLIQVGAIFEKYFNIEGEEEAEKIAIAIFKMVRERKEELLKINIEKSKELKRAIIEK